jgi:hypothetical protein
MHLCLLLSDSGQTRARLECPLCAKSVSVPIQIDARFYVETDIDWWLVHVCFVPFSPDEDTENPNQDYPKRVFPLSYVKSDSSSWRQGKRLLLRSLPACE